jgi:hypothetical protein
MHAYYHLFISTIHFFVSGTPAMDSTMPLKDITIGNQKCKVFGHLLRLWDAINMRSKFPDPLISIDGILLDEEVSTCMYYTIIIIYYSAFNFQT